MKKLSVLLFVALTGCATATQVKGPNGEAAYEVQCGNAVKDKCTQKAAQLCPNGYTQLERKGNEYDDLKKVGNIGVLEIKADTTTYMLIQCK